jgi:hypothetical protein
MLFALFMVEVLIATGINVAIVLKLSYHEPTLYADLGKPSGLAHFSPWHRELLFLVKSADPRVMKHGIAILLKRSRQMTMAIFVTFLAAAVEIART